VSIFFGMQRDHAAWKCIAAVSRSALTRSQAIGSGIPKRGSPSRAAAPAAIFQQATALHHNSAMSNQITNTEDFPAELPPGVWAKRFPWKVGSTALVRDLLVKNIQIRFDFTISIFFPFTFFFELSRREFFPGSEVPGHRDALEPIYGCVATLLLRNSAKGGQFKCEKILLKLRRLTIFNGSRYLHSVTPIEEGSRDLLQGAFYFAPWPAPICRKLWRGAQRESDPKPSQS
jgi:hypothetical protein